MFAESLLESNGHPSGARAKATLWSFGLQSMFVALLVAIPVIFPMALPLVMPRNQGPVSLVRETILTEAQQGRKGSAAGPVSVTSRDFLEPSRIPTRIVPEDGSNAIAPSIDTTGVPLGNSPGVKSAINMIGDTAPPLVRKAEPQKPVRVSEMSLGALVHKVQPVYPFLAKQVRVQGEVLLRARIGQDGSIQELRVVSGHPMLINAAMDAVRQWKYRPYILNGSAIDVETQITVRFNLGQ